MSAEGTGRRASSGQHILYHAILYHVIKYDTRLDDTMLYCTIILEDLQESGSKVFVIRFIRVLGLRGLGLRGLFHGVFGLLALVDLRV